MELLQNLPFFIALIAFLGLMILGIASLFSNSNEKETKDKDARKAIKRLADYTGYHVSFHDPLSPVIFPKLSSYTLSDDQIEIRRLEKKIENLNEREEKLNALADHLGVEFKNGVYVIKKKK